MQVQRCLRICYVHGCNRVRNLWMPMHASEKPLFQQCLITLHSKENFEYIILSYFICSTSWVFSKVKANCWSVLLHFFISKKWNLKKDSLINCISQFVTRKKVKNNLKSDSHLPENFFQIKIFPSLVSKNTIICLFGIWKWK